MKTGFASAHIPAERFVKKEAMIMIPAPLAIRAPTTPTTTTPAPTNPAPALTNHLQLFKLPSHRHILRHRPLPFGLAINGARLLAIAAARRLQSPRRPKKSDYLRYSSGN